jgi:3-oxoacyl-[acyl-carrier-protein] synthase-1
MIPVPITAYAIASACGLGSQRLLQVLQTQQTALGKLTLFELPFSSPVGELKVVLPTIKPELEIYNTRNSRVALAALNIAGEGLRSAIERASNTYGAQRIGVVIGTSTSGLYETESAYEYLLQQGDMPDDFNFLTRHAYQATPRFLQQELALQGPCFAISTACSSGAKAIAAGQRLINNDVCDAVLVGGVDTLCRMTLRGFHSLELVSDEFCRPMDRQRKGINIGEAAGLLLLEKPHANKSHFPQVMSVGESSDAYHMSTPHPEGKGAKLAMTKALAAAGLKAAAIDYVNLHATATRINDHVEAKAV